MNRFKTLSISLFGAAFLAACDAPVELQEVPVEAAARAATAPAQTYLYAHALFGEPVFDRDVISFERALTSALGRPADVAKFGYTDGRLSEPTPEALNGAIARLAGAARDGEDVVVVMMTTHGSPEFLAQKPANTDQISGVSAEALATFLEPLNDDKQVIILQACYSGSLIDDLAHPNRIILTAAAADRTSFGCSPDNDNTFFIKSLNAALSEGGSWSEIFGRTKSNVEALETSFEIPASDQSNPQSYVGRNMIDLWRGDDRTG